jgi:hypothetical protein
VKPLLTVLRVAVGHVLCLSHRGTKRAALGGAGIAAGSIVMFTAHGAGWMMVPALGVICRSGSAGNAASAWTPMMLALAGAGVHIMAMLAVAGFIAAGATRHARI